MTSPALIAAGVGDVIAGGREAGDATAGGRWMTAEVERTPPAPLQKDAASALLTRREVFSNDSGMGFAAARHKTR